jgi:hypothetical protein
MSDISSISAMSVTSGRWLLSIADESPDAIPVSLTLMITIFPCAARVKSGAPDGFTA